MHIGYSPRNSDVPLSSWENDKEWLSPALIRPGRRNINAVKPRREAAVSLGPERRPSGGASSDLDAGQLWASVMGGGERLLSMRRCGLRITCSSMK